MAEYTDNKVGLIDVRPIYAGQEKKIVEGFVLQNEDYGFSDVEFLTPVTANAEITQIAGGSGGNEGYTELTLTVSADIKTICARCTEEIKETIRSSRVYGLTRSATDEDSEDYISTENGILDAYEAARTQFLLDFPGRFLCSEDCRGLCAVCGKNLNAGECDCEKKEVDPRLAVLANLKFD